MKEGYGGIRRTTQPGGGTGCIGDGGTATIKPICLSIDTIV